MGEGQSVTVAAEDEEGPVKVAAEDGTELELSPGVWEQSETIVEMAAGADPGVTIPLPGVGKDALEKTVEYMEQMAKFKAEGTSEEDKKAWIDNTYKKAMEPKDQLPLLLQTINAANFMNVNSLLDELCKFVAKMISQRNPKEILEYFNITEKASVEEELDLISKNTWIEGDNTGIIMKDLYKQATKKNGGVTPNEDEMKRIINELRRDEMSAAEGVTPPHDK